MRRQRLCCLISFCLLWLCAASVRAAEAAPGGADIENVWPFKDVPEGHKYREQIAYGLQQGYITPEGELYKPDSPITRREVVGSLWIVNGKVIVPRAQKDNFPFADLELIPGSEGGNAAAWAFATDFEQQLWRETAEKKLFYKGNETITRGQLLTYLYRASLKDPFMKALGPVDMSVIEGWDVDRKDVGYDAKAVAWGAQYGMITPETVNGKPSFRPDAMCTKGEFSDIMSKYAKKRAELKAAKEVQEAQAAQQAQEAKAA